MEARIDKRPTCPHCGKICMAAGGVINGATGEEEESFWKCFSCKYEVVDTVAIEINNEIKRLEDGNTNSIFNTLP